MGKLRDKEVLVSGATGFLGSTIAKYLVENGAKVSVLVRQDSSLEKIKDIISQVNVFQSDFFNKNNTKIEFDYFFHAATCYGRKGESQEEIYTSNVTWPLEVAKHVNHRDLIFINFGTSLPRNTNDYSITKMTFIDIFQKISLGRIINLKLEQFYGPNDGTFVSFIIDQFKSKTKEIKLTIGTQKRDFIFYKDVISSISVILNSNTNFAQYTEFEIGTGTPITIREVVETIQTKMNAKSTNLLWGTVPLRPSDIQLSTANLTKLNQLGWHPQYNLNSGLDEILKTK